MTASSQPTTYSVTSSSAGCNSSTVCDTITIDMSGIDMSSISINDTICTSYTNSSIGSITSGASTYTISNGSSFTLDSGINISDWKIPIEWVNGFPEWDRIEKMCKLYPGLQIAFEKFKTTYKLVQDEYDNPTTRK